MVDGLRSVGSEAWVGLEECRDCQYPFEVGRNISGDSEANVKHIAVRVQMGWALFRVEVQRTRCLVCWRQEGW